MFSKIILNFLILQAAFNFYALASKVEVPKEFEEELPSHVANVAINNSKSLIELKGSFVDGSSTCGDTLRSSTGAISYKHFGDAAPNERCVWIVRAPGATAYLVTLVGLGIPSSVIIQGFGYGGSANTTIPTTESEIVIENISILVITFHTGASVSGHGFSLRYRLYYASGTPISSSSEDIISPASAGHIKYPAGTKNTYEDYELSPFVFIPAPGASVYSGFKKTDIIYIRNSLEANNYCTDSLKVYTFDRTLSSSDKWRFQGEICGGVDSAVITNNDLILLLFQSDDVIVGSGFHLYSRIVNSVQCPIVP